MKVKLIQSGGFLGRTRTAEIDLTDYDSIVQNRLDYTLMNFCAVSIQKVDNEIRDGFEYCLEYNGTQVKLNEKTNLPADLYELFDQLKGSLKY